MHETAHLYPFDVIEMYTEFIMLVILWGTMEKRKQEKSSSMNPINLVILVRWLDHYLLQKRRRRVEVVQSETT